MNSVVFLKRLLFDVVVDNNNNEEGYMSSMYVYAN